MAISLEYRFTFINVLEEIDYERSVVLNRRSQSLPPSARSFTETCDAIELDKKDGEYVQTLTEKLPSIFSAQDAEVASISWTTTEFGQRSDAAEESEPGSNISDASNPGSVGHPELCRIPCIYFAQGLCRNSTDCNFCHLSHAHRSATLDKNQRQIIKELSKYEFLSLLLRCLRNKAVQGDFEEEAKDVLELFEERLSQEPPIEALKANSKASNLERALGRMTFFSVASLTTRKHLDQDFLERCKRAVGQLRVYFN